MTAATWHFFDEATGLFSGASFSGTEAELAQQLAHRGARSSKLLQELLPLRLRFGKISPGLA